ncbi:MAG: DUF1194 domain-containing protein [Anderseniella sp.]
MKRCLWATGLLLAGAAGIQAQGTQPVELELVLAVDTSTSVDADEFDLQTSGLAQAFLSPEVVSAIRAAGGDQGVAISLVQWAGKARQATVVDWQLVHDAQSAAAFAARIAATKRIIDGLTDIAGAIDYSVKSIEENRYEGTRKVIDVSGDGSSDARSSEASRNSANAKGIIINGLVIHNVDYSLGELANIDLHEHYANHVIGGSGAFLMTAKDYADFKIAIRAKLVREITGPVSASAD